MSNGYACVADGFPLRGAAPREVCVCQTLGNGHHRMEDSDNLKALAEVDYICNEHQRTGYLSPGK